MHEIVICADVHEGMVFHGYRRDAETGVPLRNFDLHENLKRVVEFAIKNNSALFIILGDLFDNTHVAPVYREMIRRDIIEPLGEHDIELWIIGGNHDLPRNPMKSTSLEDFRGYSHVNIYDDPTVREINIKKNKIKCLILPYLHPEGLVRFVKERTGEEHSLEEINKYARPVIKEWLAESAKGDAYKILFAHIWVEGAKICETSPEISLGEFSFDAEMIPEVDLCVLGHIHLHQELNFRGKKMVYVGAVERIDWGERGQQKGFLTISLPERTYDFIKLPVREMEKIEVNVKQGEDPTKKILDRLGEVDDKLIRLEIRMPHGLRSKVYEDKIRERLDNAFHAEVKWIEEEEKMAPIRFTTNPFELLREFIQMNFKNHPRKDDLQREGEKILREVIE